VMNLQLPSESGSMIEDNRAAAKHAGLRFYHLPMSPTAPDPRLAGQFLNIMSDSTNLPVYVHCETGKRAATLVMLKRVAMDGWPLDRAAREARISELPNGPALQKFVADYVQALKAYEQAKAKMPQGNVAFVIHV